MLYTREQLEEMSATELSLIALDDYQLNVDDYLSQSGVLSDGKLIDDMLAKQQEIISSLPPNLLESAKQLAQIKEDYVHILKLKGGEIYAFTTPQEYNLYLEPDERWERIFGLTSPRFENRGFYKDVTRRDQSAPLHPYHDKI